MNPLAESLVTSSSPIVSSDLLESVKILRNDDPSYHDISSLCDTCDVVSKSPYGSDLSKAYVKPSVMRLPTMISVLFAVSINTSLGLLRLQIASSTGCAANNSSTDRSRQNAGCAISET